MKMPDRSLWEMRDAAFSSPRFTLSGPACLSSGRQAANGDAHSYRSASMAACGASCDGCRPYPAERGRFGSFFPLTVGSRDGFAGTGTADVRKAG